MKPLLLLAVTIFCFANIINAQAGQLDPSFGSHGVVKTSLGKNYDCGASLASKLLLQPDGSIYVVQGLSVVNGTGFNLGNSISKRFADGSADVGFGVKGTIRGTNASINTAAVQFDGKIVTAGEATVNGTSNFAVARYNTNGSPDSSFAGDGKQTTHISSVNTGDNYSTYESANLIAIQKDGKIIIAGLSSHDLYLVRYNADGSLDATFDGDGVLKGPGYFIDDDYSDPLPTVLTIQSDGKIIAGGGGDETIIRYNTDGSIDTTFSVTTNYNTLSLAIQKDGKLIGVGNSITRYNIDGSVDKTFGNGGRRKTPFQSNSVVIQNDGKIVVVYNAGYSDSTFYVNRYNANGSTDSSFSQDGKQETKFNSGGYVQTVALQFDGKVISGGGRLEGYDDNYNKYRGHFALTRYTKDGSLDNTFNQDGKLVDSTSYAGNSIYNHTVVQKDGKAVAAGTTWNGNELVSAIVRYNIDGSFDSAFLNNTKQISSVTGDLLALQTDGKLLVAGGRSIKRINSDGTLDNTFNANGNQTEDINDIKIQNDGKIVALGNNSVTRYNTNGSLDNTFGTSGVQTVSFTVPGSSFPVNFTSLALQNDGKIVLAGYTGSYPGYIAVAKLNTNGSFDNTFDSDGVALVENKYDQEIYGYGFSCSIIIQKDNKIIVGADLENLGYWLTRFNVNGSIDNTFNGIPVRETIQRFGIQTNTGFTVTSSLALQNDGKIVAGGTVLLRYNIDGSIDSTFNIDAYQSIDFAINDIAISNNKLYVVGGGYYGTVARYLLNSSTATPPTVSITTPADSAVFGADAYIKINATAADADGTVSKVDFYVNNVLLHTETAAPYNYQWKHVAIGSYTINAKATDNTGLVTTSAPVHITVIANTAPSVSITTPAKNQTFAGPTTIRLAAAAKDADGTIAKVEFYSGSTLLRTETTPPYTYTWTNVAVGNYAITARAIDNLGTFTNSAVVNISVVADIAPTVSLTDPANGENFAAGDTISLRAAAADPDGSVSKVEFYNGNVLLATQYSGPYTAKWKNVPAGTYTLTAKATDNLGKSATSAPVTVRVSDNAAIVSSRPYKENQKTAQKGALSLRLSPNPATDILNISTNGLQQDKPATLLLISVSGNVLKNIQISKSYTQLDVSNLASGVYMIKITIGNKIMYKQFVKL